MANTANDNQQDCVGGDQQQMERDSATLLAAEQPINVDNISTKVITETSSQHQPRVESLYVPSSKVHYPVLISAPEMFTGGSPLGGTSLSIEEPVQLTLRQRIRRRLPSRAAVVMLLACVAFWLCGFVFGVAGLFFELHARTMAKSGSLDDRKKVPRLRKVSCALSIVGIVIGSITIIAVTCSLVKPQQYDSWNNYYNYRWEATLSPAVCQQRGYYVAQGKCYQYKRSFACSTCLARKGFYLKGNCYYNEYSCPGYSIYSYYYSIDQCFTSRQPSKANECPNGYYDTPKPDCDGYFVDCACYKKFSKNFTEATCKSIQGFYIKQGSSAHNQPGVTQLSQLAENGTCFYNSFDCTGYSANGQCSANRSTGYTAGTCRNIGGYMDSSTGYCYHNGFNCPYYYSSYRGQCYTNYRYVRTCGSCMTSGGFPGETLGDHRVQCSYNSNDYTDVCKYFLIPTGSSYDRQYACEQNRSTVYNEQQCTELDGIYNDSYCYYTPSQCPNYTYHCECYNYRSSLSRSACNGYDGKYDSTHSLCYYNSTVCHYFVFNNACYHYRSQSGSYNDCDGAFDDFNKVCYY